MRASVLAVAIALTLSFGSCGGNSTTAFPPGLQPWDMPNQAMPPAPTASNPYPETLTFVELTYTDPSTMTESNAVHARAYIDTPVAAAWHAARDPQTGRDPTSSQGFVVLAYADDPTYPFTYRTQVTVNNITTLVWDCEWRHGVVAGSSDAPTVTATRWQKTMGDSRISVLEGSLVLRAVDAQPNVTAVEYEYHLSAPLSGYSTIEDYLTVIFGRLRDRAHGMTLNPNDCSGCPAPPTGY